ncbi:MAG: CDP-glycerol glycerophosphotransferase [Micromonosporaceae bacterium]|nr:CDP-glycerol glycerophosphotransferase [Micromonosporaceae bacterium]
MSSRLISSGATVAVPGAVAAVAFLASFAAPTGWRWLWLALAGLTLVLVWLGGRRRPRLGAGVPARALLAAGAMVQWTHADPGLPWPAAVGGGLLLGLLLGEDLLYRAARPVHVAANLPGSLRQLARLADDGTAWAVSSAAIGLLGLFAVLGWPAWTVLLPAAGAALLSGVLLVDAGRRRRTGHRAELAGLRRAVAAHQPAFLLYFSAPAGSEYQVTMWLPYLERIGAPFAVVLPESHHLPGLARATGAPVVGHRTVAALEALIAPSLRTVFYVNNGMKNAHCVRFTQLTHVQLYHGYSDKPVSVNPIATSFDRVYVPGQAIVDQFRGSGVDIPEHRFRIVGRPQAEGLALARRPVHEVEDPVVLYAPTWAGEYADSNYCSLPIATEIVRRLLERGATVIVRPHPYTKRDPGSLQQLRAVEQALARDRARTGRPHLWGPAVSSRLTVAECMNRSDALVCDVSSIASQYLYTQKPYAITDMVTDDGGFTGSLPLARAGYVIRRDAANLPEVLDDLLVRDPRSATRPELRSYYLGDFPPERYAEGFLAEARRCVSGQDGPARRASSSAAPAAQ